MGSYNLQIDQAVYGSCTKYATLAPLIQQSYAGSSCTELNIFLDVYSIIRQFYSTNVVPISSNKYNLTEAILNTCGHYRDFFKNIGVKTNIFIIYGHCSPDYNTGLILEYNERFKNDYIIKKDISTMVEDNMNLLNLICMYLPSIYFFNIGSNEVSAMIDHIIKITNSAKRGIENLIISKESIPLQLIPLHNARVLKPKKIWIENHIEDKSIIVDNSNLWNCFTLEYRQCKQIESPISTLFFSNVLTMTRVPERDLPNKFSIKKSIDIIRTGLGLKYLEEGIIYDQNTINLVITAIKNIMFDPIGFDARYKCINPRYQSSYVLPLELPWLSTMRFINLEDMTALREIASKYFGGRLMLDSLMT